MFVYTAKSALDALKISDTLPLVISSQNAEGSDIVCNGGTKTNGRSKKATKNGNGVAKKPGPGVSNGNEIRFPQHFPDHLKSFIEQDRAERKKEIETLEAEQVILCSKSKKMSVQNLQKPDFCLNFMQPWESRR